MAEHVMIPIVLDKTSKINLRLSDSINLRGDNWRCGLKSFSLDKKWSLLNEKITLVYTNGYKSVLQPKTTHSITQLHQVLEEMFPKSRSKRQDFFDEITNAPIRKKKPVTPPPALMPMSPRSPTPPPTIEKPVTSSHIPKESLQMKKETEIVDDKFKETPKIEKKERSITPPPALMPMDPPKSKDDRGVPERVVTPPPAIMPMDPKVKLEPIEDDKMMAVVFPTDEPNQRGDKRYLVYKNLKDAFLYSPELPTSANHFTKHAAESVNFIFNGQTNLYVAHFDEQYVRAIHFSTGLARALGFPEVVTDTDKDAVFEPIVDGFHSHIFVYISDIICPVHCGSTKENVLDILPVSPDNNPISVIYEKPKYIKMAVNTFNVIEIEFRDIFGNPIIGDNALGHIILEFVKK